MWRGERVAVVFRFGGLVVVLRKRGGIRRGGKTIKHGLAVHAGGVRDLATPAVSWISGLWFCW